MASLALTISCIFLVTIYTFHCIEAQDEVPGTEVFKDDLYSNDRVLYDKYGCKEKEKKAVCNHTTPGGVTYTCYSVICPSGYYPNPQPDRDMEVGCRLTCKKCLSGQTSVGGPYSFEMKLCGNAGKETEPVPTPTPPSSTTTTPVSSVTEADSITTSKEPLDSQSTSSVIINETVFAVNETEVYNGDNTSLGAGSIVGITVGVIFFVVLIGIVCFVIWRYMNRNDAQAVRYDTTKPSESKLLQGNQNGQTEDTAV